MMSSVCVVGLGYIGLPVAAMLASRGFNVSGFDVEKRVVDTINDGRAHFVEPDLDMLLEAAIRSHRLHAHSRPTPADYFVIAVPTPVDAAKRPDLSHVDAAIGEIAPLLRKGSTVIIESTVPVGTTERVAQRLASLRPDLAFPRRDDAAAAVDVHVAYCPERILPGQIVHELISNDRIIGGVTEACAHDAKAMYQTFVRGECAITDCRTAEFVKLAENAYRDVNIAFANELSLICEELDINIWQATELANRHPRVNILKPGPGVGGHCIAVDPWFIIDSVPQTSRLIRTAREVNTRKTLHVIERVMACAVVGAKRVVACYGIAYKPDVGDLRESPALEIVKKLGRSGRFRVLVCDPMVAEPVAELADIPDVELVSLNQANEQAEVAVFLVGHSQFRGLRPGHFQQKLIVDVIGLTSSWPKA
jgi:UDP-N-acetyl-D-mannosaminuronic acid dehydrogenase